MTYAELVTKIRDYTEVDSNVFTATIINGFIQDAEFRIFRDVDVDNNRVYYSSNFIASQKFLSVPNDVYLIESLLVVDTTQTGNPRSYLEPRDVSFITEYNSTGATGVPKYYGNYNDSNVIVAPTPASTYAVELNYILKPTQLSSTNTSTFLSTKFPNGLLYACLLEAYGFLKGPTDMLQLYETKYKEAVQGFALEQMGRRRRDEYHDGVPRLNIQQNK
jgi:hypothetical protein